MLKKQSVTDIKILVGTMGIGVAASLLKIEGDYIHIKGTLAVAERSIGEAVEFWIPLGVLIVRFEYEHPYGYVLREEVNGKPGLRAWVDDSKPPKNEISF